MDSTPVPQKVFIGIDYHQSTLQACVMNADGHVLANRKLSNDWMELAKLAQLHGSVQEVAIEACNGAMDLADQLTELAGWHVSLAHAGYVHKLKQSPDKTDFGDARVLADLTRVGYLPRVWHAPRWERELRRLVRHRMQLAQQRRACKLRIRALLRDHRLKPPGALNAWTQNWWAWLKQPNLLSEGSTWLLEELVEELEYVQQRIKRTEKYLEAYTQQDAMIQWLQLQPGIGPITAWMLRAEVGRFKRFGSGKALSRFAGLSPRNASSGQRQADAGLIKAGNNQLRAVLIEASHMLARHDPRWSTLDRRLREAGKPASVAKAAVANRWLRWLWHAACAFEDQPRSATQLMTERRASVRTKRQATDARYRNKFRGRKTRG